MWIESDFVSGFSASIAMSIFSPLYLLILFFILFYFSGQVRSMARPAAATATLDHGLQGKLHFPEQPEEGGIAPGVPAAARGQVPLRPPGGRHCREKG